MKNIGWVWIFPTIMWSISFILAFVGIMELYQGKIILGFITMSASSIVAIRGVAMYFEQERLR